MTLLHRIIHYLGWNMGHLEFWNDQGRSMVGFRCQCGELLHPFELNVPALDGRPTPTPIDKPITGHGLIGLVGGRAGSSVKGSVQPRPKSHKP